jgi:MoxR-like ATPase
MSGQAITHLIDTGAENKNASALNTEAWKAFQKDLQTASSEIQASIFKQAQKTANDMLDSLRGEIVLQFESVGKPRVLAVQVEGVKRELSKPASPYLGRMLVNARLGLNTLLVGPAGCGKTMAAEQLAESLALPFGHLCLTAGASETWLFGRQTPTGFVNGAFAEMYETGGVFLLDEFDAADPNTLLAINTALANAHLYNPISGKTIARHANFHCVAAANTTGRGGDAIYTGRARLDAATLDRFCVVEVDYSDEIEFQICPDTALRTALQEARKKLRELRSTEVISTRTLERAHLQLAAGVAKDDVRKSIIAGWPEEVVEQCGLGGSKKVTKNAKK